MNARLRGVLAIGMAVAGAAMIALATLGVSGRSGRPLTSAAVPWLVGFALMAAAVLLARRTLAKIGHVRREARRGLRQIDVVLRLEATLAAQRLAVPGAPGGCPSCGAPAGPHCVCRRKR